MEDGMETVTREQIDQAHEELGTSLDPEPQEVYAGDELDGDLVIDGSGQLSFSVGGKQPTTSSLRLTGGKVDVQGSYTKGERVAVLIECVVGEVAFIDQTDAKTGQVIGCERRHKARITAVRPA